VVAGHETEANPPEFCACFALRDETLMLFELTPMALFQWQSSTSDMGSDARIGDIFGLPQTRVLTSISDKSHLTARYTRKGKRTLSIYLHIRNIISAVADHVPDLFVRPCACLRQC